MNDRQKNFVLAAALTLSITSKEKVLELKHGKRFHTLRDTIAAFGEEPTTEHISQASTHYSEFKRTDDKQFEKAYPALHKLWHENTATPVFTGGAQGKTSLKPITYDKKKMLKELNAHRKSRHLKVVKSWKSTAQSLQKALEAIKSTVPKANGVKITKLPAAVAEGAYVDRNRVPNVKKQRAPSAKTVMATDDGLITLSDIAAMIKMAPKIARAIARKNKTKIRKLETSKYKFKPTQQAAVIALLKGE